jgi:hypothetical protein
MKLTFLGSGSAFSLSKENYQSRAQFENLPVGEALDSQSNIVESIMSWNKDGQLWKSEAF